MVCGRDDSREEHENSFVTVGSDYMVFLNNDVIVPATDSQAGTDGVSAPWASPHTYRLCLSIATKAVEFDRTNNITHD